MATTLVGMATPDAAWWARDQLEVTAGDYIAHHGNLAELLCLIRHGDLDQVGEVRAIIESHRQSLAVIERWMAEDEQRSVEVAEHDLDAVHRRAPAVGAAELAFAFTDPDPSRHHGAGVLE